ncbi:15141_t:CDS:2 [Dentiscutata erythropus]|uniref:15141_t:CDS:1 n=1 Tax=Dentiscutata erythropus TaxID=1348616 RepID=A0A9N8V816_9GLOM|nr:15141_t:CDS:2 [Dentiscutata erythropus]
MRCAECEINKLSKEFPSDTISKLCKHIPTWCLKCLIGCLEKPDNKDGPLCPQCNVMLTPKELEVLKITWEKAPFLVEIPHLNNVKNNKEVAEEKGEFYVALLNGQKYPFGFEQVKTVRALKQALVQKIGVESRKQKLIFEGVELKDAKAKGGGEMRLVEYGVREGSHIQLIVVLYSITKDVSIANLSFNLHWGFPVTGQDFLDGTCLIYAGRELWKTYDYAHQFYPSIPYIRHSGDIIDNANRRGNHIITIKLDQLPPEITKLYFILSAWECPNIGHFRDPSFLLFDEDSPEKEQLCDYAIQTAATSQAVIMCYVSRSIDDTWEVIPVGRLSNGNAQDYTPVEISIRELEGNIGQ